MRLFKLHPSMKNRCGCNSDSAMVVLMSMETLILNVIITIIIFIIIVL